jgi:predicted unusual protein kinase regulating ubiquinone biosynthesis (AarF/ABC1/UbiB family)
MESRCYPSNLVEIGSGIDSSVGVSPPHVGGQHGTGVITLNPTASLPRNVSRRTTAGVDRPTGLRITLRTYRRFVVVVWSFLPLLIAYARDARRFVLFGRSREVTERDRRRRAEYLLETFLDLGPTFIKIGQILSTRPDVLPPTYVDVLSRLQDRVPPDPWSEVEPIVAADVGPVDEAFDEFDTDPISGASLGQVYTAVADGERVAVKVRRPGIVQRVEADLRVIGTLLPPIIRFAPPGQAFTMENLADEFETTIREELDYEHEAAMLTAVGENFADDPDVRVPRAIPAYSTERVLTMEYVDGTKINDVEAIDDMGLDREALVRRLEETYIEMIIEHGLFQADPHPGNIAVKPDGTLVFYDFGVTGRLDAHTQETLFDFYVAVAEDDVDAVIDAFIDLGALDPTVDREWMREVFEIVFESLRGGGVEAYEVREIVSEFQGTLYEFPLRLPQNLALIVRVSTVLEGVCRALDDDFDFIAVVRDYVRERGPTERNVQAVAERFGDDAGAVVRGLLGVPEAMDAVLTDVDREAARLEIDLTARNDAFDHLAGRVVWGLLFAAGALSTTVLFVFADALAAELTAVGTALVGLLFARAMRRGSGGLRVNPSFTRYNMRRRNE